MASRGSSRMDIRETWYLGPGQTLENTRVRDRGRAMVVSRPAWDRIRQNLDRKLRAQQAVERELAMKKYLKDGSHDMTKNWDNSVENVRKRRLEEREQRLEAEKEERMKQYFVLKKEQEERRNQFIAKAKEKIYYTKPYPRDLNSGLVLSEVLHEREAQIKLENELREEERQNDERLAQSIRDAAKEFKLEVEEKERKRRENANALRKETLDHFKEKNDQLKSEYDKRIEEEVKDLEAMKQEMITIKELQKKETEEKKRKMLYYGLEAIREKEEFQENLRQEDKEENQIMKVYADAKNSINQLRRKKEQEIRDEALAIRAKMYDKLKKGMADNQSAEEEMLLNQQREIEEREDLKIAQRDAHALRMREEKIQSRKEFLIAEEKRIAKKKDVQKWAILNRYKKEEMDKIFAEENEKRIRDMKLETKTELKNQMKEAQELAEKERLAEEEAFKAFKDKLKKEDEEFLAYAESEISKAKALNRPVMPMMKVVERYKLDNNLEKRSKNLSQMRSNVPINQKDARNPENDPSYFKCDCKKDYLYK